MEQTHQQIVDRYNSKKAIFEAMIQGRRITLEDSMEFAISQMHTAVCQIRRDINKKHLPYQLNDRWVSSRRGKRIKQYWIVKVEAK